MDRSRFTNLLSREAAFRLLASLGLAVILWALVTVQQDPETTRAFNDVPVVPENLNASLVVVNPPVPVRIELSGPESVIDPIAPETVVAALDLAEITEPGSYELPIGARTPDGIWDTDITPDSSSIVVETAEVRDFPLGTDITDLDEGSLRTVDVVPELDAVRVSGPTSVLNQIDRVVLPIEVSGGTREFSGTYAPEAQTSDDQVITGIAIDPEAIGATIHVSVRGKSVAVLASIAGSPAPGFEVADRSINPQFVIVDGDEAAIDALVTLSTEPIDVEGANTSFTEQVGIAELPEGVEIIQPADGNVDVLIQIAQRGGRQALPSQHVSVVGVGEGLEATVTPDEITIEVVAPDETLSSLDAQSFQVVVDASGLGPGTHMVVPSVVTPPRVQWISTTPPQIELMLVELDESATPQAAGTPEAQ